MENENITQDGLGLTPDVDSEASQASISFVADFQEFIEPTLGAPDEILIEPEAASTDGLPFIGQLVSDVEADAGVAGSADFDVSAYGFAPESPVVSDPGTGSFSAIPDAFAESEDSVMFQQIDGIEMADESDHHAMIIKRIIRIVVAIAVLIVIAGAFLIIRNARIDHGATDPSTQIENPDSIDSTAAHLQSAIDSVPDFAAIFGKDTDEVLSLLGDGFKLIDTQAGSKAQKKEGIEKVAHLGLYHVSAIEGGEEDSDKQIGDLYCYLDAHGEVLKIDFSVNMDDFGFPSSSFADLVSDGTSITDILKNSGLALPENFEYVSPSVDDCVTKDKKGNITKEFYSFSGSSENPVNPTSWTLGITYDHSVDENLSDVVRTMTLSMK